LNTRISAGLKPLNIAKNNNQKFFAFDVETVNVQCDDYIRNDFLMCSVTDGANFWNFWDRQEAKKFLLSRRTRGAYIFATNLDFDLSRLWEAPEQDFFIIVRAGKIIYAKKKITNGGKTTTRTFLDTWNYQKMSVKKMGEMLKCPKLASPSKFLSTPKTYSERREFEIYCQRDALITWKYADLFKDFCNTMQCRVKATISSTGLDYWRRHSQEDVIWRIPEDLIKFDLNNAYKGGRCEVIKRGLIDSKVYCYDYNSHYPAVCTDGVDGKGSYPDPNSWHTAKQGNMDLVDNCEGIAQIKADVPKMHLPPLGVHQNHKLIFPTGKVSTVATFPEIRQLLEQGGKILEFGKTMYYTRLSIPFKKTIKTLYAARKKYKLTKHPFEQLVKTMMNGGVYGKFGYNPYNKEVIVRDKDVFIEGNNLFALIDGKRHYFEDYIERDRVFYLKKRINSKPPTYCVPIYSTYTTALARCKLWTDANKVSDSLVYMDTDSIHTTKKYFSSSKELGELDLEYKVDNAVYIRPKLYMKDEQVKSKGVRNMTAEQFISLPSNPELINNRFIGYKEGKSRGFPHGSIIKVPKHLNLEDTKRLWKGKFSMRRMDLSKPLNIT